MLGDKKKFVIFPIEDSLGIMWFLPSFTNEETEDQSFKQVGKCLTRSSWQKPV